MDTSLFTSEIRAVLLLFIIISGSFLENTLNCNIQKALTDIPMLRHLFLLLIIFFTIDFTSKNESEPFDTLKKSFVIYIFYIMLTKQNFSTLIIILILLVTVYILYLKINYENKIGTDTTSYQKTMDTLSYVIGGITIVGFGLYLNRQYTEHSDNFEISKFIFGTNKCDYSYTYEHPV
jgi:hypothetical protein